MNTENNESDLSLFLFRIFEVLFISIMGTALTIFAFTQLDTLIGQILFLSIVSICTFMIFYTIFLDMVKKS